MPRLTQILEDHHRRCDENFAAAEAAFRSQRWQEAATCHKVFHDQMEAHFQAEENLLFPAFESATGQTGGPTTVMRSEHVQMRALMAAITDAIAAKDANECAGQAETLLIMMQQHNIKEENILYPMCDGSIGGTDSQRLAEELEKAIGAK